MSEAPRFDQIRLLCKKCEHKWDDWHPVHVPLATWIAHVKAYSCPNCGAGAKSILIRREPLKEEAPP